MNVEKPKINNDLLISIHAMLRNLNIIFRAMEIYFWLGELYDYMPFGFWESISLCIYFLKEYSLLVLQLCMKFAKYPFRYNSRRPKLFIFFRNQTEHTQWKIINIQFNYALIHFDAQRIKSNTILVWNESILNY